MSSTSVLVTYFTALDAADLAAAAACMDPDAELSIHMPNGVRRISGRRELVIYLEERGTPTHRHVALSVLTDHDVETVIGAVVDRNDLTLGYFVGVVRLTSNRLIGRYQVFSHPDFSIVTGTTA